jgi:hypothetical protein
MMKQYIFSRYTFLLLAVSMTALFGWQKTVAAQVQSSAARVSIATTENASPWRIGLVGNIETMFSNQALIRIARLPEEFLSPLKDTLSQGVGGGIELEYSIMPWFSFALRGEYAQMESRSTSSVRLPAGGTRPPEMIQGQPAPRLIERRTALTYNAQSIAATPLARVRLWNVLTLSGGARFDAVLQMPLAYTVEIDSLVGTFVTGTSSRRTLYSTPNFVGRTELAVAPVFSIGATVNIGKLTLMPEIQLQTQYRPFAATNWSLVALRGNLSVLLNLPLASPDEIKVEQPFPKTASTTTITGTITGTITATALNARLQANTSMPAPEAVPPPLDTVVQRRDTTMRVVSWGERDTIRLTKRTIASVDDVVRVVEIYERSIPKSRPFLVADLDVRFISTLLAPRFLETSQAARLATHRMIIRHFRADEVDSSQGNMRVLETIDTIETVRMPILRFVPEISSELGIESSVVEVFTSESGTVERFAVESKRTLDWDIQHLFLKPHQSDITRSLVSGTPLYSFLTATDTDGQIRRSDTVRVLVESLAEKSDKNVPSTMQNRTPNTSVSTMTNRMNTRSTWLIATLSVPLEESGASHNDRVIKAFVARLPRGKQFPCTVYVNASNNEASATQYAQTLATQIRTNALQARIVRRAQSFNAAATIELIVAVEEK